MYRTNEADETLVMLTLAGEQGAYEALVTRHQRAAVASALAVTKTRFLAEDAAQDAPQRDPGRNAGEKAWDEWKSGKTAERKRAKNSRKIFDRVCLI